MNARPQVSGPLALMMLLVSALAGPMADADSAPTLRFAAARGTAMGVNGAVAPARPPAASLEGFEPDGTWREHHLLQVSDALSVYDAAHDELLSLGGTRRQNWALPLTGAPEWQLLPQPSPFSSLLQSTSAHDAATGLVYFLADGPTSLEVRTLEPQTGAVTPIVASGTPPPFTVEGAVAFDPGAQRVLLIGGTFPVPQVWVLDLLPTPTWSQWTPTGTPPPFQTWQLVVDPVRRRLLLPNHYGLAIEMIWALTLDGPPEWLSFPTNGLPLGANPNPMVYDPASDMVWTIDGQGMTYFLSLLTHQWSPLATIGPAPPIRGRAGITIDAVRHHLVVNSGATPPGDDTHDDAWALPLDGPSVWTVLDSAATRAPIRGGAGDGYDAARHRLLVFGGSDELGSFRNDTWALDLGPVPRWTPVATQGALPPARYWHATAWDDTHDRLVAFGGYDGNATQPLADLWTLSFGSGTPTWTPITPPGPAPAGRIRSQLVYDSSRDRFLLIAGYNGAVSLADVWELRLSPTPAWRLLTPGGAPPAARSGEMCVYEPAHDRVLMFGGSTSNTYFDDLWALNLGSDDGAWQQLPAPGGPSRRTSGLLRLDPGRGRLYLFGGDGFESPNSITHLNDTWALDLLGIPTWHALAPAGLPPEGRDRANGAYDPIHDRLVVTCGNFGLNDVHTLDFGDAPTPTLISLAIRDVTPDRVRLVWGGAEPGTRVIAYRREPPSEWRSLATLTADGEGYVTLEDRDVTPGALLEYRLGVITGQGEEFFGATRVEVPRRALALAARATDGRAAFTVELPRGEPATLALFDIAGRGVWTRAVGDLGAGVHEVRADDVRLPPTLYFARLTQGRETCVVRFVIVH